MIVLGLAGGLGHDASAALVIDGQLVALAEEERFTRRRHANDALPVESAAYCLVTAGLTMSDVDVLATSWINADPADKQRDMQVNLLGHPYFSAGRPRWQPVAHPLAHAAAAYYTSGFNEATIVSVDGVGDGVSTLVAHARDAKIEPLRTHPIGESLGLFYLALTNYLGFRFGQEGKVMGLACYGVADPGWMPFELVRGGYRTGLETMGVDRPNFGPPIIQEWKSRIQARFGPAPAPAHAFSARSARLEGGPGPDGWREHVAASGQHVLEQVLLHVVEEAVKATGCRDVVLAGGVGFNCSANGVVWRSGMVDRLAVFPASGDAGTSAGAALAVAAEAGEGRLQPLGNAALGPEFDDADTHAVFRDQGVDFEVVDDVADRVADLLVEGNVVGWFQGRAEAGPRALGQRSILASPLTRGMHERVNRIKNREQWRPLAPTMSETAAAALLVNPGPSRFMLSACAVREEARSQIPAVVHVDGSCRPQIVDDAATKPVRDVLHGLAARGHPEVMLNTSFNLANEPIVHCPSGALRSFFGSGLDALAIGSTLVRKPRTRTNG